MLQINTDPMTYVKEDRTLVACASDLGLPNYVVTELRVMSTKTGKSLVFNYGTKLFSDGGEPAGWEYFNRASNLWLHIFND